MSTDEDTTPEPASEQMERAHEEERLHRRLQHQGEDVQEAPVLPRERERHEAIDEAVKDAERSVRHAAERRAEATRSDR